MVYVYNRAVPGNLVRTVRGIQPGELFGWSVSVSGNYLAVGAPGNNTGAMFAGKVYVYDLSAPLNPPTQIYNPFPAAEDFFGFSVSVSGDRVLVGGPGDDLTPPAPAAVVDAGSAYLFNVFGIPLRTWQKPVPVAGDGFGSSVSLSGNNALIGAPFDNTSAPDAGAAYLFDAQLGNLSRTFTNPTPQNGDLFGSSVSVWGDYVLVGAPSDNTGGVDSGSAYLFSAAGGGLLLTINNPSPGVNDGFGSSVAVSSSFAAVGAPRDDTGAQDAGSVYVFDVRPNPPPPPAAVVAPYQGIVAWLRRVKKGRRRWFMVQVGSARTGQLLKEFRCPYQQPAYRNIQVQTLDNNGDGLGDTILMAARRGRRRVTRPYPMYM
jgi:hypothetical protein